MRALGMPFKKHKKKQKKMSKKKKNVYAAKQVRVEVTDLFDLSPVNKPLCQLLINGD